MRLPPKLIDQLCDAYKSTRMRAAQELVERCAKHPDNKNMEDVGFRIAETLKTEYPNDEEMLTFAIEYMMEKAKHQGCGPDADHDCPMKNCNAN